MNKDDVDAYKESIRNATVEEIFEKIESKDIMFKLGREGFAESIKSNKKVNGFDKVKLILYFILVDLLYLSSKGTRLNTEDLNWANFSDWNASKFLRCISDFINNNHLGTTSGFGSEFCHLNNFIRNTMRYGANGDVKDVYKFFDWYCYRMSCIL